MTLPWSEDVARTVRDAYLARANLMGTEPELISFRQNAIFRIPGPDISVRVYGPGEDRTRADLMVRCARWLDQQDFPAVRLAPIESQQPFDLLGHRVSIWKWIDRVPTGPRGAFALGQLLRRFHGLPAPAGLNVPELDQISRIRARVARIRAADLIPKAGQTLLAHLADRAAEAADALRNSTLGGGILHGDAMPGNALPTADGMVMIDLDSACFGPREWDLAPMYVTAKRFARDGESRWLEFLSGYGTNETVLSAGLQAASLIKQVSMTIYLCLSAGQTPEIDAEIAARLRMWADGDETGRWTTGFSAGGR